MTRIQSRCWQLAIPLCVLMVMALGSVESNAKQKKKDDGVTLLYLHEERPPEIGIQTDRDTKQRPFFSISVDGQLGIDKVEGDDVLTVQYLQGRGKRAKKLGKQQICKLDTRFNKFVCNKDEGQKLTAPGVYQARLSYKRTEAGKTYPDFAVLEFKVVKYINYFSNKGKHEYKYALDLDFHIGEAWMYELPRSSKSEDVAAWPHIWFKVKNAAAGNKLEGVLMRCYHKGKMVATLSPSTRYDSYFTDHGKKGETEHHWVLARFSADGERWAADPPEGEQGKKDVYYYGKHPGPYQCKVTARGEVVRELTFDVGPKGTLRQPKCVMTNQLSTSESWWLLQTKVKGKYDAPYDKKAFDELGFLGRGSKDCDAFE